MAVQPTVKNVNVIGQIMKMANMQRGISITKAEVLHEFGANASQNVKDVYLSDPYTGQKYFMCGFSQCNGTDVITK